MASGRWADARVQPVGAPPAPHLTTAELAPGWLALSRDPRPLLGLPDVAESHRDDDLLARRDESFAPVQEHYYAKPPQIERGWRHYLMSTDGRVLPRHGQQRHGARPRPSAGRRRRGTSAAQAEHQLALQLRGGGGVQRAARRHAARTAGHRVPGQLRFGGKRSGDPAGDRGHRADAMSSRSARPTTAGRTAPTRCRRRSPTIRTRLPPGPTGCTPWSRRTAFAASTAVSTPHRYAGDAVAQIEELIADGPPARRVHLRAGVRQRRRHGAAGRLSAAGVRGGARRRWARHRRRGPGRLRPARRLVLGLRAAEAWCPTSCRSRSRRATATRSAR